MVSRNFTWHVDQILICCHSHIAGEVGEVQARIFKKILKSSIDFVSLSKMRFNLEFKCHTITSLNMARGGCRTVND